MGFLAVALREQPRATARNREPAYGNDRAGLGPISGDFVATLLAGASEPARSLNLQNREIWKVFCLSA